MTPLLFLEVLYPQSRQSAGILAHLYLHTFPLPIGDSGLVVADISKIRITAAGTAPDSHRIPSHQKKENFPDYRFYMAKVKKSAYYYAIPMNISLPKRQTWKKKKKTAKIFVILFILYIFASELVLNSFFSFSN